MSESTPFGDPKTHTATNFILTPFFKLGCTILSSIIGFIIYREDKIISKYSFNLNACFFFKQKNCDQTDLILIVLLLYTPVNNFQSCQNNFLFSWVEPEQRADKVSCSRTQHSDPGESRTILSPVYRSTRRTTVFHDQTVMVSRLQ